MQKVKFYRAVEEKKGDEELFCPYKDTMRAPGNVPYIVDNLWEWSRPEGFPCRRHAAYASPSPQLALQSGPEGGKIYLIEFFGEVKIAQLKGFSDSKEHPDCKLLKKTLINLLKESTEDWWLDWDLEKKKEFGQLWMPCLRKREVEHLFANVPELHNIRSQISSAITYWNDVELIDVDQESFPDKEGEIFFEAKGGYQLVDTKQAIIGDLKSQILEYIG